MNTKKAGVPVEPYSMNPDIVVYYELEFKGDTIVPKTPLKFKNKRDIFRFRLLAHNIRLDTTWIDCYGPDGFNSFYVKELRSIVKPKKPRQRKNA